MAILGDTSDLSRLIQGASKVNRDRKRTFDAQLRKSGADALGFGAALLELFETLPAAMIASETTEMERLAKRYGDAQHPRVLQVADAVARLEGIDAQASRGRVRAARAMESLQAPGHSLFGFVTDDAGNPRVGYTVRITAVGLPDKLRANTASDGYFRIALSGKRAAKAGPQKPAKTRKAIVDDEVNTQATSRVASVEILDPRGRVAYRDALPLQIDSGSAYREYRIGGDLEERSAHTVRKKGGVRKPKDSR